MDHQYIEENNIADLYLMGRLSDDERAGFEMHFINCDQCVDLLEEVKEFRAAMLSPGVRALPARVGLFGRFLNWLAVRNPVLQAAIAMAPILLVALPALFFISENRRLSRELEQARATPPQAPLIQPPIVTPSPSPPTSAEAGQPNAAGGVKPKVAVGGFPGAQANTAIFVLSSVRGDPSATTNEITLPDSQQWFVISVELEGSATYSRYRARVYHSGKALWQNNNLVPNKYDALAIGFNSTFFPPGEYVLNVDGITAQGKTEPLSIYPFRIIREKRVK